MTFCLSKGKFNKKYKLILIGALFAFLTNCLFGYIYNDSMDLFIIIDTDIEKKMSNHIIYHNIFRFLGILVISYIRFKWDQRGSSRVTKNSIKSDSFIINESSSTINLIYEDSMNEKINNLDDEIYIIFISVTLLVIGQISEDIYYKTHLKSLDFWMLELPIVTYISYKRFNMKVFRHHIFAVCINLIICTTYKIISLIVYIGNTTNEKNVYYKYNNNSIFIPIGIVFYLLYMIPRAYSLCQIKYLMDLKYISPYIILIIYGLIGTIICTIIGILSTFIKCNKTCIEMKICNISNDKNQTYFENIYLYWKAQKEIKNIILEMINLTAGIITNYYYYLYYILVIKNFSPMHIIFFNLTYTFGFRIIAFIINIINNIKKHEEEKVNDKIKIIQYLGFVDFFLVFFGLFVYLEMIALNCCKLNYNLRENIINRSIKEYELDKVGEISGLNIDYNEQGEDSFNYEQNN